MPVMKLLENNQSLYGKFRKDDQFENNQLYKGVEAAGALCILIKNGWNRN